jgi:hypothetical protein
LVGQVTLQAWMFKEDRSMNRDFVEMLSALVEAQAEFLVVLSFLKGWRSLSVLSSDRF